LLSIDVPEESVTIPSKDVEQAAQLLRKGIRYFEQSDWEAALACFNKGLALNPSEKRLWSFKLEVLYKLERFKEIDDCALKALNWLLKQSKEQDDVGYSKLKNS
jgi:tetratricopeptide (TPR) repeat protein